MSQAPLKSFVSAHASLQTVKIRTAYGFLDVYDDGFVHLPIKSEAGTERTTYYIDKATNTYWAFDWTELKDGSEYPNDFLYQVEPQWKSI